METMLKNPPGAAPAMSGPNVSSNAPQPEAKGVSKKDKNKEIHEKVDFDPKELKFDDAHKMYTDAKRYTNNGYRDRWDQYFRVYRGERVKQSYFGTISVSNREPHTIIETLVSNIAGGLPEFHFVPTNQEQSKETAVLNGILDYYLEYNEMNLKNQIWVRDMLMYGTGILYVAWRDGKPWIENIPLRDFFVAPTATGMVKTASPAQYAGFEYLALKSELENTWILDAKSGDMVKKYKNLEKIGDQPNSDGDVKQMDKKFKDMFYGSTLEESSAVAQQVHVVLLFDLVSGKMVEIGNMKEFIYYDEIPFQREEDTRTKKMTVDGFDVESPEKLDEICPFLPFAVLRDYIDSSLFYGEGELAVIFGDSELLNDYESMEADNNAYQNTPMFQIDPQFADLAAEIETIPGAVYPIPKGALSPIDLKQATGDLQLKIQSITSRMRRETAADEAVQGVSQQKGRVTATEVDSQLNQAQTRFSTKITNLGSEGYSQLGSIIFKMMQIFLTPDVAIRIKGKDGIEFRNFDPWEFNGEYEPQVKLDSEIKQKEMEVGMRDNQVFEYIMNNPVMDQTEVLRYILKKKDPTMTDDQFNEMKAKPLPPPEPDAREFVQLDKIYVDPMTPPDIKMQIEEMIGLTPSPTHHGDMQNTMMKQAADGVNLLDQRSDRDGNPIESLMPQPETPVTE